MATNPLETGLASGAGFAIGLTLAGVAAGLAFPRLAKLASDGRKIRRNEGRRRNPEKPTTQQLRRKHANAALAILAEGRKKHAAEVKAAKRGKK